MTKLYGPHNYIKYLILIPGFFIACSTAKKQQPIASNVPLPVAISALESGFKIPPDSIKLSIFWYWLNDNISKEGINKDLDAMAKIGIGRAFLLNCAQPEEHIPYGNLQMKIPIGKVKFMSEEWWQMTEEAMKVADRNKIELGLYNSPSWSAGGPWIREDRAMQYLSSSELKIKGPLNFSKKLPEVDKNFRTVSVIAFPEPQGDDLEIALLKPKITSIPLVNDIQNLFDRNLNNETILPQGVSTIDLIVNKEFTARSLMFYPGIKGLNTSVEFQLFDGKSFRTIHKFQYKRTNNALNVGFKPYDPVCFSLPATSGKKFRLLFNTNLKGSLREIKICESPRLEMYVEKQLGKMYQEPLPLWNEYQWVTQQETLDKLFTIDPTKIIDITKNLNPDGTLNWKVPAGKWIVIQYGLMPTGVLTPYTPKGSEGFEIDKLNEKIVAENFDAFMGKILDRIPAENRKAWKWVIMDSFEGGPQNWSEDFTEKFKLQYNYDPIPFLPVLTGRIVRTANESDRFMWDLRRLVADGFAHTFARVLREKSNQNGLKLWLENYGHWGFMGEFLQYGGEADEVAGEVWSEGDLGSIEARAASSAAHIYGKNIVSCETFTAGGDFYLRYPGKIKKRGDWTLTEGINNSLLVVYFHQPDEDKKPGIDAPFSTEFNRHNVWFEQAKGFVEYLRRCNFMLQQGKPVNDVAYFIGEDTPKMTGERNPEIPKGYSYDYINAEVIKDRLHVKNGNLVLPDGMSYKILVLPQLQTMRPELLNKIKELVYQGATVLGPRPSRSPSFQNYPATDEEVKRLAQDLWGEVDGINAKSRIYGKGKILSGMDLQTVLNSLNVIPDFKVEEDSVLYVHRTFNEGEIYFVSNQTDKTIEVSPEFRVKNKQPEFWDAVTGAFRNLPVYTQSGNITRVPLILEGSQSGFLVFRKPVQNGTEALGAVNFPQAKILTEITSAWEVTFDPSMRGPKKPVVFEKLMDWTKRPEDSIRFYSGTAVYRNTLKIDKIVPEQKLYLNLNPVKVMAKVKVNGIDQGIVWTAPWRVEVTKAVKPGINKLEIEVVNNWANRLIGYSKDPYEKRKTYSHLVNAYNPYSPLDPSGMKGPVVLEEIKY